jgi:tricorn protease-like protein
MKKVLIAFCALFFLSTLTYAKALDEKVKIEKQFVTVEKAVTLVSVDIVNVNFNEIKVETPFLLPSFKELNLEKTTTIKDDLKPDKSEADLYNCKLKENCLNIQRSNYHKIL